MKNLILTPLLLTFLSATAVTTAFAQIKTKAQTAAVQPANTAAPAIQPAAVVSIGLQTTTEQIEVKPAHTVLEIIASTYSTVTEQILVKPESKQGSIYATVTEQILVKEASKRLEIVPAVWQTYAIPYTAEKPCLGKPKMGSVTAERLLTPATTREIEIPAEYRTVTKQVVSTPGTGAVIPAEYQTITKLVIYTPSTIREIMYPATFKTVSTQKCAN